MSLRRTLSFQPKATLTAEDIRGVFQPVVDKINALVDGQIQSATSKNGKPPKFIILVGGFGRCKYLYENLKSRISTEILQSRGTGPWTAICRGAVIHALTTYNLHSALAVHVESRISRASYGVRFRSWDWDPAIHEERDKVWSEKRQQYMAANQMQWFLKEGEKLTDKAPVRHSYQRLFDDPPSSIREAIYMTTESPPPARAGHTVINFCEINWETNIDLDRLPTYKNSLGTVYSKLDFDIEMTCSAGSVDFAVFHEGKRVGSKNVSVEFHDHYGFADQA